jgi:hypothetical protein
MSKNINKINRGDLVMFQRPHSRWWLNEEPYIYGMIKKIYPPGSSWNKAGRIKYDVLGSDSRVWSEISHEKLIILSTAKNT